MSTCTVFSVTGQSSSIICKNAIFQISLLSRRLFWTLRSVIYAFQTTWSFRGSTALMGDKAVV